MWDTRKSDVAEAPEPTLQEPVSPLLGRPALHRHPGRRLFLPCLWRLGMRGAATLGGVLHVTFRKLESWIEDGPPQSIPTPEQGRGRLPRGALSSYGLFPHALRSRPPQQHPFPALYAHLGLTPRTRTPSPLLSPSLSLAFEGGGRGKGGIQSSKPRRRRRPVHPGP